MAKCKNADVTLRELLSTVGVGTWDWDILGNFISYNDEYLKMLGYSQTDMNGSIEEWKNMNHSEDMDESLRVLNDYLEGKIPSYECEIRMKHKDGHYIWTRDVGRIVTRDSEGNPTRLLGGHLNIDGLKRSEQKLTEAFATLEHNNLYLEQEIQSRTKELVEQDKMLYTVNQISRKLLTANSGENFANLVNDCLRLLGESINRNRVYIWKDRKDDNGQVYCTQIYEWVLGAAPIQGMEEYEEVPYTSLPNFNRAISSDSCLNSLLKDLDDKEKEVLEPQGIKSILIAPVAINGVNWGFIGVDNCEEEELFTSVEENTLLMSGFMLANSIEKMDIQAKMREMEERTQVMLDATPLCCNLWSRDFCNTNCNEEAVRLFELSSQEEYLKKFNELSPEFQPCGRASNELAMEYISKAFDEGNYKFKWMHQKLDKTPIPAEITLERMKFKDDYIVAGYTRDLREFNAMINELQTKEEDLRKARDEALLSSKAKSNFLANMSHEIRTPMNAISGLAEIILREGHGAKISEYAKGIKGACGNLLNIINDILDISKIESGKLEVFNEEYELASLINDVIAISRMRLEGKSLMFVTDIDSKLPAKLIGDEIRIKQILINMLSNAIKFTSEGYIALRVYGEVTGNEVKLHFTVKDSGVGVRPEDISRLFDEFERIDTTKNRDIEGTGLGLSISKQLCEMMDGEITVKSVYGEGSEFKVTMLQKCDFFETVAEVSGEKLVLLYEPRDLYRESIAKSMENLNCVCVPCKNQSELYEAMDNTDYTHIMTAAFHLNKIKSLLKKKDSSVPIAAFVSYGEILDDSRIYNMLFPVSCLQLADFLNGEMEDGSYSKSKGVVTNFIAPTAKILVVDDNFVNLQVAKGLMAPYEFKIDTATNGLEAVQKVKNEHYDLVLMDHMMPVMDGIDATVAIRQLSEEYYKKLPIIALTANAIVGAKEMFIREGMDDFLAKPIEINKLGQILVKWLPENKVIKDGQKDEIKQPSKSSFSILGVNIEQGILSLGGSTKNYFKILAAYYDDGMKKCDSLMKHVLSEDILAFRIEIHAVKSASATIGALDISTIASKLESAAEKGEKSYIDENLDGFISKFRELLDNIAPVISNEKKEKSKKETKENKPKGDITNWETILEELKEAAECANIAEIERLIEEIEYFRWEEVITNELSNIKNALSIFDYDEVLESVERLREKV